MNSALQEVAPKRCRTGHYPVAEADACPACQAYYEYWLKRADEVCAKCGHIRRDHRFFTGGCDTCWGYKHGGSPNRCKRFKFAAALPAHGEGR